MTTTARATACWSRARSAGSWRGCLPAARWPGGGGGRHEGAGRWRPGVRAGGARLGPVPIAGGGSFNDAPVLAPGRYKDTLRGGEQLFYAVNLKPGQQLTAGATVSGRTEGSYFMKLNIYSPLRQKDAFKGSETEGFGAADKSVSLRVEGQRVGERNAGGSSDSVFAEPGTYYVSVAANNFGRNLEADQFDTLLDLQVTGAVIPQATPTATAKPAATVQSGQTAGGAATAAPASSGSRSCSASRWAGWWASASGGCGCRRSVGAGGEEAAEGADQRAQTPARCRTRSRPGRGRTACPAAAR